MRRAGLGNLFGLAIGVRGEVFRALLRGYIWIFSHASE